MMKTLGWILPLVFVFSGCIELGPEPRHTFHYILDYQYVESEKKKTLDAVIHVDRFTASPSCDTTKMVYTTASGAQDAYLFHKWWAKPRDMLTHYIARDLGETKWFTGVFSYDSGMRATHRIEGKLDRFHEKETRSGRVAEISMVITLIQADEPDLAKSILFQKTYSIVKPLDEDTPKRAIPLELSQTMAEGVQSLSNALALDIYAHLSKGMINADKGE